MGTPYAAQLSGRSIMELTNKDIQDLKAAHKQEFNEDLTDDQAREMGRRLLLFLDLLRRHPDGKSPRQGVDQPTHRTGAERPREQPEPDG